MAGSAILPPSRWMTLAVIKDRFVSLKCAVSGIAPDTRRLFPEEEVMPYLMLWGWLCVSATTEDAVKDAVHLETVAALSRMAIPEGEVQLVVKTRFPRPNGTSDQRTSRIAVAFSEDRLRFDRTIFTGLEIGREDVPLDNRKIILLAGQKFFHSDDVGSDGRRSAVTWEKNWKAADSQSRDTFDPRMLGLLPVALFELTAVGHNWQEVLGRTDRMELVIEDDEVRDQITRKISYVRRDGLKVRMWIAPKMGHSILKAEFESKLGNQVLVDSYESTPDEYPWKRPEGLSDGKIVNVWYPRTVIWTRTLDGEFGGEERVETEKASFGPVDSSRFELSGLGVPAGTSVLEFPPYKDGSRVWNGMGLELVGAADAGNVSPREMKDGNSTRSTSRFPWIFVSLNLALFAIAFAALSRWSNRARSD